jgi:hypothetical protein
VTNVPPTGRSWATGLTIFAGRLPVRRCPRAPAQGGDGRNVARTAARECFGVRLGQCRWTRDATRRIATHTHLPAKD